MSMIKQQVWMAAVVGCCTFVSARAQQAGSPDRLPFVITVHFENDGTFVKPNNRHDRHYTNGIEVTVAHQPRWAEVLAPRLPCSPVADSDEGLKTAAGYAIGQSIITPQAIEPRRLIPEDRPYAGWLYGGVYLQRASGRVFDHFEVDLGVIGPSSLAEEVQRVVHDLFNQVEPGGWDNQLGDEFGIDFVYQRKWKVSLLTSGGDDSVQLIPQVGFVLGTVHRHAGVGVLVRMGVNLPDDFGPGRIQEPGAATGSAQKEPGGYFFVRVDGQAVEHNTLLEGNNHRSSHGVDPETLFGQVQVGLVFLWDRFELGYAQTFQSRQFESQRGKDSFGGLTFSWRGHF